MGIARPSTLARLPDSDSAPRAQRGIVFDTLTVSTLTILAKVMGAAKAVVMAHAFGSGAALDSYLLAFLVPSFLADVFCGPLVPTLVPKLADLAYTSGPAKAVAFYGQVLRRSVWLSSVGAAVVAGVAAVVAALSWGSARVNFSRVGILTLLMMPILPLACVANVWRAVLNAQRIFATPALTAAWAPVMIMLCILLAGGNAGIWILAVGTSLASAAEVAVLGRRLRGTSFPILPPRHECNLLLPDFWKEYGYLSATTAMNAGSAFVGLSLAGGLGTGSVSVLNFGTRLSGVLMAIGPAALSITLLPRFADLVAARDWQGLQRSLVRILSRSMLVASAAAAVLIVFSVPIVRITLQRGAFTGEDAQRVASVQTYALLQLPFVLGVTILLRVLSALRANRAVVPLSGVALAASTALSCLWMGRSGVAGIALAASVGQAILFGGLAILVFRRSPRGFLRDCDSAPDLRS